MATIELTYAQVQILLTASTSKDGLQPGLVDSADINDLLSRNLLKTDNIVPEGQQAYAKRMRSKALSRMHDQLVKENWQDAITELGYVVGYQKMLDTQQVVYRLTDEGRRIVANMSRSKVIIGS